MIVAAAGCDKDNRKHAWFPPSEGYKLLTARRAVSATCTWPFLQERWWPSENGHVPWQRDVLFCSVCLCV